MLADHSFDALISQHSLGRGGNLSNARNGLRSPAQSVWQTEREDSKTSRTTLDGEIVIADSLTHVTANGRWFSTAHDASESRLLQEMDNAGVDKAVVVALAGYIENGFVSAVCARHPHRLIPGASINPAAYPGPREAAAESKALASEGRFAALKLHPRLNEYDPLDSRCLAVLEEMASGDRPLPIWLDTYFRYPGGLLKKPPVETIHELVGRFPSLIFVLLHACGPDILRLAEAVRSSPNCFLDISYTMHRFRGSSVELDLRFLLGEFDQRILFGSDFPEVSITEAVSDFDSLGANLGAKARARILGENLRRVLGV